MKTWIRVEASYFGHPKVIRLRRSLGPEADIYPLRLWAWAATYSRHGAIPADDIESACSWSGVSGQLVRVLTEVGFLDADGSIHDWSEYSGGDLKVLETKRKRDRKRIRSVRDVAKMSPRHRGDVAATSQSVVATSPRIVAMSRLREEESREEKRRPDEKREEQSCSPVGRDSPAPAGGAPAGRREADSLDPKTPQGVLACWIVDEGRRGNPDASIPDPTRSDYIVASQVLRQVGDRSGCRPITREPADWLADCKDLASWAATDAPTYWRGRVTTARKFLAHCADLHRDWVRAGSPSYHQRPAPVKSPEEIAKEERRAASGRQGEARMDAIFAHRPFVDLKRKDEYLRNPAIYVNRP